MADRLTLDTVLREALAPKSYTYRAETVYDDFRPEDFTYEFGGRPLPLRDPIFTPILTTILASSSIGFVATNAAVIAGALSAIATTALTIGLQYLMAPKPPSVEQIGRNPMMQPIPYRFWGVGEARGAGAFMLWEAKDNTLYAVQAMIGHRIQGYKQLYLHDDAVTIGADGKTVTAVGDRYKDNVRIYKRLGAIPEAAMSDIVGDLGPEGIWTSDHRGDGQASLGMIVTASAQTTQQKKFPNGLPRLSSAMELALVWDFRDPAQSPDDPTTWTYSRNSILCLAWHECFNPFGTKRDYRKAILPVLNMWKEEADVCNENVARASGGTEKRYEVGGIDRADNDPKSGTNAILASMDGWMCERGDGALLVVAGKYREKYCGTITDADLVGYTLQHDVLPEEECNRLIPKFTYPATDYTTTDTDFFEDTAAQLSAGRVLPQDMALPWVNQWRQARRLGKREWIRIRQKKRGTLDLRLTALNACYLPWSRLQTPKMLPGLDGKVVANKKSTLALMRGGFQMVFQKMPDTPSDIDAWTPATDEGAAPPVPGRPDSDGIPQAVIDSVTVMASSGSVSLRVAVLEPQRDDLGLKIGHRTKDTGSGAGPWVETDYPDPSDNNPGDGLIVLDTGNVPNAKQIEVRAAFTGHSDLEGEWSLTKNAYSGLADAPALTFQNKLLTFGGKQLTFAS